MKRAHALYKSSGKKNDYPKFHALRSCCKLVSQQFYRGFVDRAQADSQTNTKKFWNFADAGRPERGVLGVFSLTDGMQVGSLKWSFCFRALCSLQIWRFV